jgi:hypothetical protein
MAGLAVYGAVWAHANKAGPDDAYSPLVFPANRRVRGGPISKLFPELGHAGDKRILIPVTILSADGVEEVADIRYFAPSQAYRITGLGWIRFLKASGIAKGDRIDVYTCKRDDGGDGERCLFLFKSQG